MNYRPRSTRLSLLSLGVLLLAACGDDADDTTPDVVPDVTDDTGAGDAVDGDATDAGGEEPPPAPEPFQVIFVQEAVAGTAGAGEPRKVMVTDSDCRVDDARICGGAGTCETFEMNPPDGEDGLCEHGCLFPPSLSHIAYFDAGESRTLRVAPLGPDRQLAGDSVVVANSLESVSVGEDLAVYRVENGIFSYRFSTGTETQIASITGAGTPWVSPDGSRVFLRRVTSLTTMDLVELNPDQEGETLIYAFADGVPSNLAGSLLGGSEPIALSPDGTRVAMLASVRVAGSFCSSTADCVSEFDSCPTQTEAARCFQHHTVLFTVNLDESAKLGQSCSASADCGADHLCDLSAPASDGTGECMPGRTILGPGGPQACERIRTGEYNRFRSSLLWRSNRSVVGVFVNDCGGQDIPITDVVAVDAGTGLLTRLTENPGTGHGGPGCYSDVEQCYVADQCQVDFKSIALSPDGSTLLAVGSSYTSRLSDHLWSIDAFGREPRQPMTRSIMFNVRAAATGVID